MSANLRTSATRLREHWSYSWQSGGPDVPPDEQAFYACSPHRIQACASILRDSDEPDSVNKACPATRLDPMVRLEDRPRRRGCRNARSPPPAPRQQSWPARHTPSRKTRPPSAGRSSEHCIDHQCLYCVGADNPVTTADLVFPVVRGTVQLGIWLQVPGLLQQPPAAPRLKQAAPLRPLPCNVTNLDRFRVQRRNRAGGVIHEYRLVA